MSDTVDVEKIRSRASELIGRELEARLDVVGDVDVLHVITAGVHHMVFDLDFLAPLGPDAAAHEVALAWRTWAEANFPSN